MEAALHYVYVRKDEECEDDVDGSLRNLFFATTSKRFLLESAKQFGGRYTRRKLQVIFQLMGCKLIHCRKMADVIFERFESALREHLDDLGENEEDEEDGELDENADIPNAVAVYYKQFRQLVQSVLSLYQYTRDYNIRHFETSCKIINHDKAVIIILSGTSGCGKSTLASLLSSRVGIPTVISSDTARHFLRGFTTVQESPFLFSSTYNAGNSVPRDTGLTDEERLMYGYREQCKAVHKQLELVISLCVTRGESLIVEGVHLDIEFILNIMKKFRNCILPFLIYIGNESKHIERFAVRSKYMTLAPKNNRYVKYFENIRCIQKSMQENAKKHSVPILDNTNVDRSLAMLHNTIFKGLCMIDNEEDLLSGDQVKLSVTHIYPYHSRDMVRMIQRKKGSDSFIDYSTKSL